LLGELRAVRHDRPLDLGARLQRHLLAILLVEAGRVVAVDRLIDLLWGETPPGAAIASLQAYVSQLRRILEPDRPARALAQVLVTQDPGYMLKVEAGQVDGTRFLRLAARGRQLLDAGVTHEAANNLDLALARWRGSNDTLLEAMERADGLGDDERVLAAAVAYGST
jgi:DNA-binding SARP family transcriptional activator